MKVPGPRVGQIVPGVYRIPGEHFRYHVNSRSGNTPHLVDLSENGFYGQCDCEAFRFKYGPKLKDGIPLDNRFQCYHIRLARRHFTESMLRAIWVEIHNQQTRPPMRQHETPQRPRPKTYQLKPYKAYG